MRFCEARIFFIFFDEIVELEILQVLNFQTFEVLNISMTFRDLQPAKIYYRVRK